MNKSYSEYIYEPLTGDRMIRLLYLNPAAREDQLTARLECMDLEAYPQYEALSYEWGSPVQTHSITIEGGYIVKITQSLFNALNDLRPERQTRTQRVIWADGICINQADTEERQRQVSIMGTIYRTATRVITYVGPAAGDSVIAIKFAMQLLSFYSENPNRIKDPRLHLPLEVHHIGLPPIHDRRWQALKSLLLRGWSSRCWCAHEFLMNKQLSLMCGRDEVAYWSVLGDIVQLVVNRQLPVFLVPKNDEDPNSLRECLVQLTRLRSWITEEGGSCLLLDLLKASHPFKTSNPRDKVYSLLGLAQDREMYAISVDYSCSEASLYTMVAARNIVLTQSVDLLYSNLPRKTIRLPSWVPDWSTWQYGSHGSSYYYNYKACGNTSTNIRVDDSGIKLHITGCIVDRISWLDDATIGSYYNWTFHSGRQEWLMEARKVVEGLRQYKYTEDEVLWRTLIGNITLEEVQATDEYRSRYEAHVTLTEESPAWQQNLAREFCDAARRRSRYRHLCATENGYFGAVPETAQLGDYICMFEGGRFLFTIHPVGDGFLFRGPSYLHNLMHGEVLDLDIYERKIITLV